MRPRLASAALAAALALPTAAARAQSAAAFELCLLGDVGACTTLDVLTTPAGPGTAVDVVVRQQALGTLTTGVLAFALHFAPGVGADVGDRPVAILPVGGAAPLDEPSAWVSSGTPGTLFFQDTSDPFASVPAPVQFVTSCGDGTFAGGLQVSSLVTCGSGAYLFRTYTNTALDAAGVTALELDVYGGQRDPNGALTVVSCDVGAGRVNACVDFLNVGEPRVPFTFRRVPTTVPEPATLALLAGGVTVLGTSVARRRRRAPSTRPPERG